MTEWMEKSACRGEDVDPEWWADRPGLAVHICRCHCPVRYRCDAWAAGQMWRGLVVGGWLRTDGSGRSDVQPIERVDGCPTCRPNSAPPPPTRRGFEELAKVTCPRCGREVAGFPNGSPMTHKHNGVKCA